MTDLHKRLMHHAWYGGQTENVDLNPGVKGERVLLNARTVIAEIVPHECLERDEKPFSRYLFSHWAKISVPLRAVALGAVVDAETEARRILSKHASVWWFFNRLQSGADDQVFVPILAFRPRRHLVARDLQELEDALVGAGISSVEGLTAKELSDLVGGNIEMRRDLETAMIVLDAESFTSGVMAMWRDSWFFSSMDLWTEKGLDMYGDSLDEYFDVERLRKISARDLEDLAGDSPALWQRRLQEMATKTGAIVQLNLPSIRVEPEF